MRLTDREGLSPRAVRWLGFDDSCRCGHEEGLHDECGRCVVIGCACEAFELDDEQANAAPG